ncbi:MAG: hypothetical protein KBS96_00040 [Lachnospiraceae bacterium]|nr:hypothetical protein [Candidatus Colinaster scatohippi]
MRIGKKLSRLLAAMLTAIMMVTSVPQTAAIAYASVPENDEYSESVDADVSSEITETHDGEDSDMPESIVSSEAGEDEATQTTDETTEEYSEEVTSTEEIVLEETPEKPTMSFSSTTPSVDNMATEGWSWDMASSTLTLDGANINKGLIFFSDATIEVLNDSSVTYNNGAAILISGSSAKDLQIIGNGTLHLSTQSNSTAALRGNIADGEHNITVSGGSLTVDCVNNYGDSAAYVSKGSLTVTDGATLNASVSRNTYALRCFSGASVVVKNGGTINATNPGVAAAVLFNNNGRLDVIEGGKFNTSSGEGHGIYINNDAGIDNKGIINVLGKGSVVTALIPTQRDKVARLFVQIMMRI